ncbi:MAG: four helix bundle protein [Gemmatimonadales bacterium]
MPPALRSYHDLKVWQAGMQLVVLTYRITRRFPNCELYGLTSQMQRSAVSIPANIAEGYGRSHRGDYLRYLSIANGSLKELETEMLIAARLGFITPRQSSQLSRTTDEIGRMLRVLVSRLSDLPLHPTP